MSGTNRLINSKNTIEDGSYDELAEKLAGDANEEAAEIREIPVKEE